MKKRGLAILFMAFLWAGFLQPAHGETGVSGNEIKIGLWTPLSGPLALIGTSARDGVRVWAREINGAGGIHGRKVNLIAYDDAASPQEAQAAVRRLIKQEQVFMLIAGSTSGTTLPVRHFVTREKVPFVSSISSNINLMQPFSRYIFRIYSNEVYQAGAITDWIALEAGVKRPAIIYNSNDYGVGGYQVFQERMEKKHRIQVVAAERYNPGDQDFGAQLLRIKRANSDGLLVFSFAHDAGIIVRQAKELGLDVKFFGGGGTATTLFQRGAGRAAVGFVADFIMPDLAHSSSLPGIASYREKLKKWFYPDGFPPGRPSEYDLAAYAAAKVTEAALKKVGPDLSREKFIDALETLRNFETGTSFPVTFTQTSHEGTTRVNIIRVGDDLEWKVVQEYQLRE